MRKRMEHREVRHLPALRELQPNHAREPVMTMHKIIAYLFAAGKALDLARHGWHILREFVFGDGCSRTGVNVDDTHTRSQGYDGRLIGLCAAGKDINGYMQAAQLAGQFTDIDVHATSI